MIQQGTIFASERGRSEKSYTLRMQRGRKARYSAVILIVLVRMPITLREDSPSELCKQRVSNVSGGGIFDQKEAKKTQIYCGFSLYLGF